MITKVIFSDRYQQIILAAAFLIMILSFVALVSVNSLKNENKDLKNRLRDMQMMQEEIIHIKDIVGSKEKKIGLTRVNGVVSALEQILNSIGLQAKVIKPLEKIRNGEFTEEGSDLEIENIDLNRIVNLLYKIENSPVPLKTKNTVIKTTFENPDMFTLNLTVSLISKPR